MLPVTLALAGRATIKVPASRLRVRNACFILIPSYWSMGAALPVVMSIVRPRTSYSEECAKYLSVIFQVFILFASEVGNELVKNEAEDALGGCIKKPP